MAKIVLTNVSKRYVVKRKPIFALEDVSLAIDDATFLAITGPSGSGKSTILQIISGIEQPTSGQVMLDDQDLTRLSSTELTNFRQKKVGIVFQQFYLEPELTLKQNMELPAMFSNLPMNEREERVVELANFMGLSDYLDHLPSELSGGQIQRAAVARAIFNKPTILIADEPTSNLDPENVANVIDLFKKIQHAYGATIIIAAHEQNAIQSADRVVKLENGRISQ